LITSFEKRYIHLNFLFLLNIMFNLIPSPAATSTTPAPDDPDKHKYGFFMVLIIGT
jgi:hypothetical protein